MIVAGEETCNICEIDSVIVLQGYELDEGEPVVTVSSVVLSDSDTGKSAQWR